MKATLGVIFVLLVILAAVFTLGLSVGLSIAWKPVAVTQSVPRFSDSNFDEIRGDSTDKVLKTFGKPDTRQLNYDENNKLASEEWRYIAAAQDHVSGEVKDVHVWFDSDPKVTRVYFRNPDDGVVIHK